MVKISRVILIKNNNDSDNGIHYSYKKCFKIYFYNKSTRKMFLKIKYNTVIGKYTNITNIMIYYNQPRGAG